MKIKIEACDTWFSLVVRLKANSTCEDCRCQDRQMQCCHIWGRRAKSVRWSLDNAICMCSVCHRKHTENPIGFTAWIDGDLVGDKWVDGYLGRVHMKALNKKRNILMPTTKMLRKEIAKHYREEHKKMLASELYTPVTYN